MSTTSSERKREYMRAYNAAYRERNKDLVREVKRAWEKRAAADPAWSAKRKAYLKRYRSARRKQAADYARNRIASSESLRIAVRVRTKIGHMVRAYLRGQRSSRVNLFSGCSAIELVEHILSTLPANAAPDGYGRQWVVDHIYPLSAADLTRPEQLLAACHWSNVRAVTPAANAEKRNSVSDEARAAFEARVEAFSGREVSA